MKLSEFKVQRFCRWYLFVLFALMFSPGLKSVLAAERKPNVVIILTDDQGWGDLSLHGNRNLQTPNIDRLARSGAQFDRFFVCPVCSPTRAEFLTGRYHPRGGVYSTSTGGERLDLDEHTIAQTFKAAGYATAAYGKWHNGMQYPYHPNARGFDDYYGFCSGHWGNYFNPSLEHNGQLTRGKGFIIDDFTNHAISFIEKNKDKPFFCYLPLNTPHSPMQVPDKFYKPFAGKKLAMRHRDPQKEKLSHTRAALAMCENIDWNVGRILKTLSDLKLDDNTIVVYFSDNGPNGWRWNGRMKGRKGSTDEGGVRSPCFIRWTGKIPQKLKIPHIAAAMDLYPTLADLCGVTKKNSKPLDGRSLKPLLMPKPDDVRWPDRMIFSHWARRVSVRTQQFRLDNNGRLFDMVADPEQRKDVSQANPAVARKLRNAVAKWKKNVLSELNRNANRPFPVGYPQFPLTHLPARDGVPHGNVKRSARAPNCSFFTNWISKADRITWNIEVANDGDYEAVVYYTCPKADVGSTIELSFHGQTLQSKVTIPFDSPLIGKADDRSPRGSESYVKVFRPMTLGRFRLQKGRGELTLRAIDVKGKQVMDVRYVTLRLLK
ncbi:MAG: arylsulfatase [Planctomycetaceae bacterium]